MTTQSRTASGGGENAHSEIRDDLKHDADRLKDSAGARAKQEAESRKGQAAQVAGSASSALDTAADDLRNNPDAPDWMASALQQASRSIDRMAEHIDGRSVDELGGEVAGFARRSPGTFLAASAAAGFAAARVLRAGADRKHHEGGASRSAQDYRGARGSQSWPADENMMPTDTGDFEPSYANQNPPGGGFAQ
ncbi:MAG: hypothetical protein GC147_07885 [Porphyrobacter sp.]|nr:hypothetical protein [Porphyrobacter sp.]